jgi:hypothetical protein
VGAEISNRGTERSILTQAGRQGYE